MNINIENLQKINPSAIDVLENRFTEEMKPDPDNAVLWFHIDDRRIDVLGRGEILPIQGKSGAGKTILVEALISAAISKEVSIFETTGVDKILYIDTEQSKNQWIYCNYRILKYSKLDKNPENFLSLHLKKYSIEERFIIIDDIIMNSEDIDLIIIDGIADIVLNENNIEEAKKIIDDVQKWIDTKDAGFITVLHENKGKDNFDMKGHVGSYLNQKATTTIAVQKEFESNVMKIFPMKTRGRFWPEQDFIINDYKMIETGLMIPSNEFIGGRHANVEEDFWGAINEDFK